MINETSGRTGTVRLFVRDKAGAKGPIAETRFEIRAIETRQLARGKSSEFVNEKVILGGTTELTGIVLELESGRYQATVHAFGKSGAKEFDVRSDEEGEVICEVPIGFAMGTYVVRNDCEQQPCKEVRQGESVLIRLSWPKELGTEHETRVITDKGSLLSDITEYAADKTIYRDYILQTADAAGAVNFEAQLTGGSYISIFDSVIVLPNVTSIGGNLDVSLQRTASASTDDLAFWRAILNSTEALSFNRYLRFMDWVLCGESRNPMNDPDLPGYEKARFRRKKECEKKLGERRFLPFTDTDAYRAMKVATEAFVMVNCGVLEPKPFYGRDENPNADADYFARRDLPIPGNGDLAAALDSYLVEFAGSSGVPRETLPYLAVIRAKLPEYDVAGLGVDACCADKFSACYGILKQKLANPCLLELIWSYWHEEGMLVQTTNAIMRRFQNIRSPRTPDPLANLEIDPLRPLNNLMWGYVQDEQHRLSVVRRGVEYEHAYGTPLEGRAVIGARPADSRSKFLEAFHHLLRLSTVFFKQDDDTTVKADAFPVLNGLKEVHLILSEGAHNQFGDLPSTARIEMLMQQWLLARPEFREFLPTRIMVAYPEPWMDRVDAMKKLQGWTDTSVLHFRNLGVFGELLLLSIRYGNWSDQYDPLSAFNWARFFRPQIQGYIHAYRAATGVDLAAEVLASQDKRLDSTPPSVLLKKQLAMQQRRA